MPTKTVYEKRNKEAADLNQGDLIWIGSADELAEVVGTGDAEAEGLMTVTVQVTRSDETVIERELVLPPSFDLIAREPIDDIEVADDEEKRDHFAEAHGLEGDR